VSCKRKAVKGVCDAVKSSMNPESPEGWHSRRAKLLCRRQTSTKPCGSMVSGVVSESLKFRGIQLLPARKVPPTGTQPKKGRSPGPRQPGTSSTMRVLLPSSSFCAAHWQPGLRRTVPPFDCARSAGRPEALNDTPGPDDTTA
jgi:hypothetical protein